MALGLECFARVEHVLAQYDNLPLRRGQQASEHFDGGRFAGAVGAEEAVKRAALDPQLEAIDGAKIAEEPRQLMGFQCQIHVSAASNSREWKTTRYTAPLRYFHGRAFPGN